MQHVVKQIVTSPALLAFIVLTVILQLQRAQWAAVFFQRRAGL